MSLNLKNLTILADYLDALPDDYDKFDMAIFAHNAEYMLEITPGRSARALNHCGTAACAVGHGPSAGLAPIRADKTDWLNYSLRVFGTAPGRRDGNYMFATEHGGTAQDAAKRIREVAASNS